MSANPSSKAAYESVLFANFSEWRTMPCSGYFIARTRRLWFYSFNHFRNVPGLPARFSLEYFEDGQVVRRREWKIPGWLPKPLKYLCLFLGFLAVAVALLPRGTWVIATYPLICLGQRWLRCIKGLKYVYWVWDHYEDSFPIYALVDDAAVRHANAVLCVSDAMLPAYAKRAPAAYPTQHRALLPHGTLSSVPYRVPEDGLIGFVGQVRDEQGVLELVDAIALDPGLRLEIIGTGPLSEELARHIGRVGVSERVFLLGRVDDEARINQIVSRWQVGAAPYGDCVVNRYCDPGKVKLYIQLGLPVVITSFAPISSEIAAERAGEVVKNGVAPEIVEAIARIRAAYDSYLPGIKRLQDRYEHVRLYDDGFRFMRT